MTGSPASATGRGTAAGITIETRARFGFTAAPGTTDDGCIRLITQHLPPVYADRLFTAKDTGASERQLRRIVAEGLQEVYFKDGRRANALSVEFTEIYYPDANYSYRRNREPTRRLA
ncbi:telomere-protecting terminal protein Tpg [Streptomyces albidochromogenes]|uniref:Telomere-protecting terminal protein Tpg n=1 Tax=Streptomyces albidochromogenes TaxID=329524 RepID=A0ABW6FJI2_9ACTN